MQSSSGSAHISSPNKLSMRLKNASIGSSAALSAATSRTPSSSTPISHQPSSFTPAQIIFRLSLLVTFNGACYLLVALFSQPYYARILVLILDFVLLLGTSASLRQRDWRLLRVLAGPTVATLLSELGIALAWFAAEAACVWVAAAVGVVLSEATVILSVCGPNPASKHVQYVATTIGLCAPLLVTIIGLFSPSSFIFTCGVMASLIASSANLLFNKA